MNEHLAELNQHVAAAAEAWLNDPRDSAVYARLVAAVQARRSYLSPGSDRPAALSEVALSEVTLGEAEPAAGPVDADDPDLGDLSGRRAPRPIGASLGDDPVAALRRLSGR